jgi:hypothetical protein
MDAGLDSEVRCQFAIYYEYTSRGHPSLEPGTYHRRSSLDKFRSFAIWGSATVNIPEPKVFRKFTPATVMMTAAALPFENCWWPVESTGGSVIIPCALFDRELSRIGRVCSYLLSELSSTVVVEDIMVIQNRGVGDFECTVHIQKVGRRRRCMFCKG